MTFALAVVMLETTASVDLFLPIIFTLFISYGTGTILINKSVYLSAIRMKNIPLLGKSAPSLNRSLTGFNIMHSPVVTFPFIAKVEKVYEILERTSHSGYPVLNGFGRPVGIIERDVLITMIENKAWYSRDPGESPNFTR
jgi:CBS domain-containing protein